MKTSTAFVSLGFRTLLPIKGKRYGYVYFLCDEKHCYSIYRLLMDCLVLIVNLSTDQSIPNQQHFFTARYTIMHHQTYKVSSRFCEKTKLEINKTIFRR